MCFSREMTSNIQSLNLLYFTSINHYLDIWIINNNSRNVV